MEKSFTKKYLKIYTAELISILLGIVSLFVVVPYISDNKEIYGVYSICISTLVFLTYADLGFLSACTKFAAEYYSLDDKLNETKMLSFGGFILFSVSLILMLFYFVLSCNPELVISHISESPQQDTAKQMFFWMAIFTPLSILSRTVQCIYTIRVEQYIFQIISIIGSILKILSVFYFFVGDKYEIVQYFIFVQAVQVLCGLVAMFIACKKYGYDIVFFLKSFRWNKFCFDKTKDLASSGLLMMISWVLYYEIDQIAIAKMYGASEVALFAVAFAILNYIRMFLGGLYSPYLSRFAHFRAVGNHEGLKQFYINVVNITFPIVVCPILALIFLVKNFIVAWAGPQYLDAEIITLLFVAFNLFAALSYPSGSVITVYEKTKTIKMLALWMPIVYWIGIFMLPRSLSIVAFGLMKMFVFWIQVLIYLITAFGILGVKWNVFFKGLVKYNFLPSLLVCVLSLIVNIFLDITNKSLVNLFYVCLSVLVISSLGYIVSYIANPYVKLQGNRLMSKFKLVY